MKTYGERWRRLAWMAAVLATAVFAQTAPGPQDDTFLVTGQVVDAQGRPVAGAVVERYQYSAPQPWPLREQEQWQRVITDTNGAFELRASRVPQVLVARWFLEHVTQPRDDGTFRLDGVAAGGYHL